MPDPSGLWSASTAPGITREALFAAIDHVNKAEYPPPDPVHPMDYLRAQAALGRTPDMRERLSHLDYADGIMTYLMAHPAEAGRIDRAVDTEWAAHLERLHGKGGPDEEG